ncbi:HtaA domain-containing protein [Corynebacterium meridianum]|uniref:YPDG domain-containing protein n=1 Tax=Corynebacterium meridianum TaxID=2765363 RepID=A0A934MAK2_9CORY|nr:HtaA domain-containing protein [Corynebacterium meridianum]MBI8989138.1 YPDG domain-containing protein [Corynebacterium meridianum]
MTRRIHLIRRAGIGTLACVVLTASPLVVSPATADETNPIGITHTAEVTEYADDTPAMYWNIRDLFMQISGGADTTLDGARQGTSDIIWPFVGRETTSDGQVLLKYQGTANIRSFCETPEEVRGECQLDLTFSRPWVTYDPATGRGLFSAVVHTVNRNSGEWEGPERLDLATFDLKNGRYNTSGDLTTWADVPSALTVAGAHAFSDILDEGDALSLLDFTYTGAPGFTGAGDGGYSTTVAEHTGIVLEHAVRLFPRSDGSLVLVAGDHETSTAVLIGRDMKPIGEKRTIDLDSDNPSAFDPTENVLYFAGYNEPAGFLDPVVDTPVYKVAVTAAGVGEPELITRLPHRVTSMGFNAATGEVGIIHQARKGEDQFTTIAPGGERTTVDLPSGSQLFGIPVDDRYYSDGAYGESIPNGRASKLLGLPDGTWLSVNDHGTTPVEGTDDGFGGPRKRGAVPIHVTPKGDVTAELVTEAWSQYEFVASNDGVAVRGNQIAIWNDYADQEGQGVATYTYDNGTFTQVHGRDKVVVNGVNLAHLAGGAFTDVGNLVLTDADKSTLAIIDPVTFEVLDSATLSSFMKGTERNQNDGIVATGGRIVVIDGRPGTENPDSDLDTYIGLQVLEEATAAGKLDPSITPFYMDESLTGTPSTPVTDAHELTPVYPVTRAVSGQKAASPAPTFTSDSGRAPGAVSYSLDGDRPGGAVVDPDTGVVTLTPAAADVGETIGVVVTVTYADGSVDKAIAAFAVGEDADGAAGGSTDPGKLLGILFSGSGGPDSAGMPGLIPVLTIGGFLALVAGLIHFLRTQMPVGFQLPWGPR